MSGLRNGLACWLLVAGTVVGSAWAHEGHDHSAEANLQILKAGPNQVFQVSVARLPDAPIAGQNVKFLARLEELGATDDPLLGGRSPVVSRALRVSVIEEGKPPVSLKVESGGEEGLYRFEHLFSRGGRWNVDIKFDNAQGVLGEAELIVPVKAAQGAWTLPLLQGMIALVCLGLVVQRFRISALRAALAFSLVTFLVGGAAFALVTHYWPSAVPPVTGDLGPAALAPPEEQPADMGTMAAAPQRSEPVYETPPEDMSTFTGTVRYAADKIVEVTNPSPGTVVYKKGAPKVGDWVKSGQQLASIQNRFNLHDASHLLNLRWDLVKVLLKAKEEKVLAETAYQKDSRLMELGVISGRQLQASQFRQNAAATALKEAEERLKLHDSQIQDTNIKEVDVVSPITGYISRAVYSSGQATYQGDILFEIVDPTIVWVEAYVFPQYLEQVQSDERVTLRSSAIPDRVFRGKRINVRADTDPVSKMVRVLYEVPNDNLWLKAGMLLSVHLGDNGSSRPQQNGGPQRKEGPTESRTSARAAGKEAG